MFEKHSFSSLRYRLKGTEDSSGNATLHNPSRLGFSQLGEGEIPLQSMAVPTSVTSVTTEAPPIKHQTKLDDVVPKEKGLKSASRGVNLPGQSITVERDWDVGDGNV